MPRIVRSIALIIFALTMNIHTARAENAWTGTQVMVPISGEFALSDGVGVRAHLSRFSVPKTGFNGAFIYAGPTFTAKLGGDVSLWISPQVTAWLGWYDNQDAFGASIWMSVSRCRWNMFLEADYITSEDFSEELYYGYYSLGFSSSKEVINYGVQVEQGGSDIDYGPHVGFSVGPLHTELQYYMDFESGDYLHTMRVVMGLGF